ncbi:MAG: FkbM family methyltransferase [Pseudomonadota bacterium]
MSEPFGAFRPSAFQERVRALARRLPKNYFGRKAASVLLGPAGGRAPRAYDVEVFASQKARLHPYDNICEKRVYLTPQLWDGAERAFLGDLISTFGGRTFNFVDVGANAGLYTLFARSEALRTGARLKAACIEADPEMAARLRFNIEASAAAAGIAVFNCAASDAETTLRFSVDRKSRGLSRIAGNGACEVRARPLAPILQEAGFQRVDAMKIDIEGHEHQTLSAFFRDAPAALRPTVLILETSHDREGESAEALVRRTGYRLRLNTARNAVFVRNDQTPA